MQFIEIKSNKRSLSNRRPIQGVGINDAGYMTQAHINGKLVQCPFYSRWKDMLRRCYSLSFQKNHPTYKDCTVCDEWLLFSAFRAWMKKQEWRGKELDKDILVQGNKLYSPEKCLLVTPSINLLLTDCKSSRGLLPVGVCLHKPTKKYMASLSVNGKSNTIGYFDTPEIAFDEYKKAKYEAISKIALEQDEPLRSALLKYKIK